MLPRPHCTFTIPSLHDGIELCGRLYFPKLRSGQKAFITGIAIFAHPYAPLGGSWDDPIVHSMGAVLLQQNYLLTTFNFRGAVGSQGTTSWTGKAEIGDYVSILMLMVHFINVPDVINHFNYASRTSSPCLRFLLGGYSYGSMIASNLPNLETIMDIATTLHQDPSGHEIRLRVVEVSRLLLAYAKTQERHVRANSHDLDMIDPHLPSMGLALGGYQSRPAQRRTGRELSRHILDLEKNRDGIDRAQQGLGCKSGEDRQRIQDGINSLAVRPSIEPDIALLLVSPLLGPVSSLLTLFSRPSWIGNQKSGFEDNQARKNTSLDNLARHPTCAIYGMNDTFTTAKRLKQWAQEVESIPGSEFTAHAVDNAGHFWRESGVEMKLCSMVQTWLQTLSRVSAQESEV